MTTLTHHLAQLADAELFIIAGPLTLRPFALSDAAEVARLANDARVAEMTSRLPHPYALADAVAWIDGHPAAKQRGESLSWAVVDSAHGRLVGAIGVEILAPDALAVLGYWIGVDFWGRGFATHAAGAVTRWAFAAGLEKIAADCLAHNVGSAKVLERCGFVQEGLRVGHARRRSARVDVKEYGLLAH